MRINRCFPHTDPDLTSRRNKLLWLLLSTVVFTTFSLQAAAITLSIQVADGLGGRVVGVPGNTDCMLSCTIEASSQALVSLFAVPDKGYRFTGWNGACADTLGPLCTLTTTENISVSARFVKTKVPKLPTKALLLLHGVGDRNTVWNEFVNERFHSRCPVVYGGVVLGEDSFDPRNKVFCYRIAFGYYDMLNLSKAAGILQNVSDSRKAKYPSSSKRLGYEVRAAVLGVLDRHPNLSLTLVGQERAALAAQSFLQADIAEHCGVVGLLALQPTNSYQSDTVSEQMYHEAVDAGRTEVLKLEAEPDQEGRISAALTQLTKSWWIAR